MEVGTIGPFVVCKEVREMGTSLLSNGSVEDAAELVYNNDMVQGRCD